MPDLRPDLRPDALAALHERAFPDSRGWSADEFAQLLVAKGVILCGDHRAFALGRITLDEAELLTIATDPAHRRMGHARAVLDAFERAAQSAGALRVFLEVAADNEAATRLYASAGYAEIGRRAGYYARRNGPAQTALILRKSLPAR